MKEIAFFDQIIIYASIESSFTKAKQLILNREVKGNFLIIAGKQSNGKGRGENQWFSPEGGLWFTAGFYNLPLKSSLTLYLALCVVQALEKLYEETKGRVFIKWPNDIMLEGKKLGGILTAAYPDLKYILAGIGLNTNIGDFPPELHDKAVSLSHVTKDPVDNEELLHLIFDYFSDGLYDFLENELQNLKTLYNDRYSFLKNKEITLNTEFEEFNGLVKGINNKGALILQLANGSLQPLYSGRVKDIRS